LEFEKLKNEWNLIIDDFQAINQFNGVYCYNNFDFEALKFFLKNQACILLFC